MTIYLGGDHAGFDLKEELEGLLLREGYTVHDLGNTAYNADDDYPDYADAVAKAVAQNEAFRGILLCGSAEGVCIVANKSDGIRAAIGFSEEAARLARTDDDANILCLPARLMNFDEAARVVRVFLTTEFSGAARHRRRIKKIADIESRDDKK